jgi:curved DNA-binding protein CbpA
MAQPDLYRVLQVDPRAEPEVIEAARNRLVRKYHPDVNPSADAGERMRQINSAYEVLSDPERRARYDGSRGTGEARNRRHGRPRWLWAALLAGIGLLLLRVSPRLAFLFLASWLVIALVRFFRR